MLGTQKALAVFVLIASISIVFSNKLDHMSLFNRVLNKTKVVLLSSKIPSVKNATLSSHVARNYPQHASATKNQARGWGWNEESEGGHGGGGGGWVYSHSTHQKGFDLNTVIGGLSLLGLLGVALFGYSRPQATTIMMMNMTGRRRRRSTDDEDFEDADDEMITGGETMSEFLARVGKYLGNSWEDRGTEKKNKLEPFKLH